MRNIILVASIAALTATPAAAVVNLNQPSQGYTYFHRTGATLEAHDAQVRACLKQNSFGQPSPNSGQYGAAQGLAGVIAAAIVDVAIVAMQADNVQLTNLENCMVVHGWDVVQLPEVEGEPMSKLEPAAMHTALEPLVGAATIKGEVIRTFNDDLAKADTVAFAPIGGIDKKSFSRLALPDLKEPPAKKAEGEAAKSEPRKKLPKKAKSAMPPAVVALQALPAVPEGSALLIARMTDEQMSPTYALRREGPDEATPAWVDGNPAEVSLAMPMKGFWTLKRVAADGFIAVIVPPGHWILDSVSLGMMGVHLCYGAPAIEVAAGDVLYLGAFGQKALAPVVDIEPARAALQGKPDLAAKLKAADYVNGHEGSCGGIGYGYALDVPGARYVDGYALGSKARLAVTPAAVVEAAEAPPAEEVAPAATPTEPVSAEAVETTDAPKAEPAADPAPAATEATPAPSPT